MSNMPKPGVDPSAVGRESAGREIGWPITAAILTYVLVEAAIIALYIWKTLRTK